MPLSERAAGYSVTTFNLTANTKTQFSIQPNIPEYKLKVDEDGDGTIDYEIQPEIALYQMPEKIIHEILVDGQTFTVVTESNSTIANLTFIKEEHKMIFNVSGLAKTRGFCNISIPNNLMWGQFSLYIDGRKMIKDVEYTTQHNSTHYTFQIEYDNSNRIIEIVSEFAIPEFQQTIIPPLLMLTTIIVTFLQKKKRKPKSNFTKFSVNFSDSRLMLLVYSMKAWRRIRIHVLTFKNIKVLHINL